MVVPLYDKAEAELSAEAQSFFTYFTSTYVGVFNQRTGRWGNTLFAPDHRRQLPKMKPINWSQFLPIKEGRPYTSNAVEGFNNAWGGSCPMNQGHWVCCENLRKEEELAKSKWRAELMAPPTAAAGPARKKKQKAKLDKIRSLISNYEQFHDKKEYLLSISAVIQD